MSTPSSCPRDRYLEYEYEKSAYQNFSFVAFRFKKGYDDVYIHCKLTVCRSDDEKSKCDSGCQEEGNQSRRKRNIHDEYRTELYVGPIKMTNEQDNGELIKFKVLVGVVGVLLSAKWKKQNKTKQNRNKETKNKNKQNIGVGATNLSQSSYSFATERHKVKTKIYLDKLVNTCIYLMGFEKG